MRSRALWLLLGLFGLCCVAYMTVGAQGPWSFVLPFRGTKLAALCVVAVAVSSSTVVFQTVAGNRILTPSIMGFDALYILVLTGLVFFLGAQTALQLPEGALFALNSGLMMVAAIVLFGTVILQARADILRMILTGVVLATMFRALTAFWQRLIDPNEYLIIQASSYARFNRVEMELLPLAAVLTGVVLAVLWWRRRQLDVLALGHNAATNLGLRVRRETFIALSLVAILVSVSTALVGPVVFLGLLVVSIARFIEPSDNHGHILPVAAVLSAITLVGGQLFLEQVFELNTPLSVVVDLMGGAVFLWLILRRMRP